MTAAFSIYDAMQYVRPVVDTTCLGMAASGGSLLLAAGAPGRRCALRNSVVMIHQPWTQGMQGKASDIDVHAREILRQRDTLVRMYARHCGRHPEQVAADMDRDNYMSAEDALRYGLIDAVIERRQPPQP